LHPARRQLQSFLPAGLPNELPLPDSPPAGLFLCASVKLAGMKPQFSLATLLVCLTVLAVVSAVASRRPVPDSRFPFKRLPNAPEIALRFALWGTPAVAATLAVLWWAAPRLKSHRHTEPTVKMLAVAVFSIACCGVLVQANMDPKNNLILFPGLFGVTSLIIVPYAFVGFALGRRALTIRIVIALALAEVIAIVAADAANRLSMY
jgi:hypothetical protein